ncbi:MAG: hypothetical protein HC884_19350 [Chloroflexaceae bacterium]|nr:hypothetical protein [Chloroflexaceae bacterium]
MLYAADGQHWKLKAHRQVLAAAIGDYLSAFSPDQLTPVRSASSVALADIIWVIEEEWQVWGGWPQRVLPLV